MKVTVKLIVICAFRTENTESSPGDFRRLAAAQTPVKNHHLMLV